MEQLDSVMTGLKKMKEMGASMRRLVHGHGMDPWKWCDCFGGGLAEVMFGWYGGW